MLGRNHQMVQQNFHTDSSFIGFGLCGHTADSLLRQSDLHCPVLPVERYRVFLPVKSKTEAFAANIAVFVNDLAADGKFHVENVKLFFALISRRIGKSVGI